MHFFGLKDSQENYLKKTYTVVTSQLGFETNIHGFKFSKRTLNSSAAQVLTQPKDLHVGGRAASDTAKLVRARGNRGGEGAKYCCLQTMIF